jgi:NTP pyrophosphatase (non-canonical NTP hydrolase)
MFDDYQKRAYTTLKQDIGYNLDPRLSYTLRGVSDEAGEVLAKIWFQRVSLEDLELEIGDCFWYCATSVHLMGKQFSEVCRTPVMNVFDLETNLKMLSLAGHQLMGLSKKLDRDGLTETKMNSIIDIIGDVTGYLRYIINYYGLDLKPTLDRNNYKLKLRQENNTIGGDGDHR